MHIRAVLAHNLRHLRLDRGLSQEELAFRAGIDRTYVSSLERGVYGATVDMLDRIAQALGVPAADLLRVPDEGEAKC
ncbi:helix-turn-helix domain-containing protein [Paracraurococcus lichenis]|uniref:Helix-turn-helix transcriptional regulator n=1 Tax=Paracraurococcus lichenis TaxID=3064888 RepID=A0ABT9E7W7_9PROT|nr:helix-turn-helix transcriptional regulator [Paracraurococcus sp. LOR1-02]MDO9712301.1 helix-turn-helix transcriptional regulator [Paracraurococcus sp. LOR1-02]